MPASNHAPEDAASRLRPAARRRLNFGWSWLWGPLAIVLALLDLVIYGRMSGLSLLARRQQADLAAELRQTQTALAQSARLRAAAVLMAAPATRILAIHAAAGEPQGHAYLNPALGAVLVATALPPAGRGRAYELWLLPAKGNPRPAGTFQSNAAGDAVAVAAHALHGATGLAVSRELAAGSAQPTGPILLAAREPQP
jgi:hypothetical protein